jgi:DNA repair ATPase RecN
MKNSEISNLKRDIQSFYRAKDEAVENQQRDLTIAFEQIVKQREEQITQREAVLVHQIALLDQRLERLSTENMALKAKHERDIEEITRAKEANRQLHYQIGQSSRANEQMEDSLGRQVSTLQYEMSKLQDQRNREKQELESQVEKVLSKL